MQESIILAIESSCDETAMVVIKNNLEILGHIVFSQAEEFCKLGGVVPEMASRMHEEKIFTVYKQVMKAANVTIDEIDAIAVTYGPGLTGSLLIGINFANSLSLLYKKKLIATNHLQGHILAISLEHKITYPMLSLVVSGGHTDLVMVNSPREFKIIGQTLDDAVGESFDKVARILDIGYPGGPLIDLLSKEGQPSYQLPFPKNDKTLDFSFSGLKSASFNLVNQLKMKGISLNKADFACSFQNIIVEILVTKLSLAVERYNPKTISVVGGVSANSLLKEVILNKYENALFPSLLYCTDNAAMIGACAVNQYNNNEFVSGYLNAKPTITVEDRWEN